MVSRLFAQTAHTYLCRRINGALRVEHLSTSVVLIHIPIGTYQQCVGYLTTGNLQTGIELYKQVEWLSVDLLGGIVSIRQYQGIVFALFGVQHGTCHAL